ncbi:MULTISPECIES: hypothetical protein [Pseudomonas]|uniref:Phage protein n=1 Tax=Metapseudomonas otitidis TaxID=319939 RepID=A0ABU3XZ90_9GAMM|nr:MULTISPECIES: hypothetical protein [Pseudomonas]MDG9785333.1 hypothetical protein [Pseudomonas otitidis]MDV3443222.1 hypothetical protein [Pseudomonas otitidis]OEC59879.1 hypothetical protein A9G05_09030 [Pseudomonas sp. ENNP23]
MDWIKSFFVGLYNDLLQWIYDFVLWIPRKLWSDFLVSLAEKITGIPAPDFILEAKSLLAQLPPGVTWALDMCQFNWGISLCMSAFALRYAKSWIPFVGGK